MENVHDEKRRNFLKEWAKDHPFAVSAVGYSRWFFFDSYSDAVQFMELCADDGKSSTCYMGNELGQYERISWCEVDKEDDAE